MRYQTVSPSLIDQVSSIAGGPLGFGGNVSTERSFGLVLPRERASPVSY